MSDPHDTMYFMLIALISVLGSGLVGIIGVLVHYLLKQGAEQRNHADRLHGEAMAAIAQLGDRMVDLHLQAMAAVAALGERTATLEAKAGWR